MARFPSWEDDVETYDFVTIGRVTVQGAPAFALTYIKNSQVDRIVTLSPDKETTALREFRDILQSLLEEAM